MYDVIGDIKLRFLSATRFLFTFTYREISCKIKISQSMNLIINTDTTVRENVLFLHKKT